MRKRKSNVPFVLALVFVFLCALCTGCDSPILPIEDGGITPTILPQITMRSVENESFSEGTHVRVSASGALLMEDADFVYTDGTWQSEDWYQWDAGQDSLHLTALYPAFSAYDTSSLYTEDGGLIDLLYASQSQAVSTPISLQFVHRFARLDIQIDDSMRDSLQSITCHIPVQVKGVSTLTGDLTYDDATATESMQTLTESNSYRFLLPTDLTLRVQLILSYLDGHTESRSITPCLYHTNSNYTCTLTKAEQAKGIHSVEDFLDWLDMYSSSATKAAKKYGVTQGEQTEYRLLNDIDLDGVDLSKYSPLNTFYDILNGMGHTIYNLTRADNQSGIMQQLGTNGIIKNLTLESPSITLNKTNSSTNQSPLIGTNLGTISNCHVVNGIVTTTATKNQYFVGFIAGKNNGLIINCSSSGTMELGGYLGGCVGFLEEGYIINCAINEVRFTKAALYCGGIVAQSKNGYIYNSWAKVTKIDSDTSHIGMIAGDATSSLMKSCARNESSKYSSIGRVTGNVDGSDTSNSSQIYIYNSNYEATLTDGTIVPLTQLLNTWAANQNYEINGQILIPWQSDNATGAPGFR
jgi:hypothetical protein